ncbi:uncharacterized protein LOC129570046 [Sitodiplosis mosellana]|uniref:uncharacterized protein LOC129570046 n=1 Tax=Sitodiplosis mosellana TaxID=263140 RepID=UPI002443B81E|nr:uncharacterized protein LOC129570046 [Sitodiplosis mosellana]
MMQRDHLFNRSTRPLLDSPPKSHYHAPTATIVQQTKKPKPTIGSDYKLHGFNDFNFVANQYKNLSNTGYPYGNDSPPASPNASLKLPLNAYDDHHQHQHLHHSSSSNGYSPYYDDDSGFMTNNSSENFSCRSNHSHSQSQSMNHCEDSNDQYHHSNENQYQLHKEIQSSQNVTHNHHKKGGFFKEWPRFGAGNSNAHHKITNSTNDNGFKQTPTEPTIHKYHHQQQYNCNKINSITPSPVNRLLDNGPFIFGVHSQACYTLPSKVKNDSVIKHSTATSVLTTKYTPIDPDANDNDTNDSYRRCDVAVIDDNAQSNNKRVFDTAAVANGPQTKEHDRRLKKNAEKCRTKTEVTKKTKRSQKKSGNAIKCVVVGDEKVGKTNLILSYLQHRFTTEHVPTASDIYNFEVKVDDSPVKVELADTAGQDFLDPLRRLCYPDSDVFLLCFSVIKPDTFVAAREKWEPIFRKTHKPIVLIGTQSDLRSDSAVISQLLAKNEKPVSKADAWDYATSIGAKYIETSSRANTNVKEAFDTAIWHALVSVNDAKKPSLWRRLLCLT